MSIEEAAAIENAWDDVRPKLVKIEAIPHYDYGRGHAVLLVFEDGKSMCREYFGPLGPLMPDEFGHWLREQIPEGYRLPRRQETEPRFIVWP